jgi:hypothetical protein
MKYRLCLLIAFVAISFSSHAQIQWSGWTSLNNDSGVVAYISFVEIKTCGNMKYCYFRFRNDRAMPNATLQGSFKYRDCEGKEQEQLFVVYLSKTGIDQNEGKWYLSNGSGVYNIKVDKVYK